MSACESAIGGGRNARRHFLLTGYDMRLAMHCQSFCRGWNRTTLQVLPCRLLISIASHLADWASACCLPGYLVGFLGHHTIELVNRHIDRLSEGKAWAWSGNQRRPFVPNYC